MFGSNYYGKAYNLIKWAREGNYLFPNFTVPEGTSIGALGQRHLWCIMEYRETPYISLQLRSKLNGYLADIDQQA